VVCVAVPVTDAFVPEALFEKLKLADPAPPEMASSSSNSMMISIRALHF
jgi:hypothetical protein